MMRSIRTRFDEPGTAAPMRLCDLTHAYTDTSGGIRTYIDAKRRFLMEHTRAEHLLVVPGPEDAVERDGRLTTVRVKSPLIPGAAPYRMLVSPAKVRRALRAFQPDLIELASLYTCPWMAFGYRREAERAGRRCAVSAFYHTDLPSAYVEPVATRLAGPRIGAWAERTTTRYVRSIFERVDLALTAFPKHIDLLETFAGASAVHNVSLGVDLDLFHPVRRSAAVRERFGVGETDTLLVFAGRLDNEKRVHTLVDALERLPDVLNARLVLVGEGPQREALAARAEALAADLGRPALHILPYERERESLAELLASADVYVTAGPHETFGLSVVEAQAAGLPVVGVDAGALRERVPEGTGHLVPVDDAEAMARAVAQVAFAREPMARAARRHVEASFSWEATFRTIGGLYERVLAEPLVLPAMRTASAAAA